MSDLSRLTLYQGSTVSWDIEILTPEGNAEDLSAATDAIFTVKASVSSSSIILERSVTLTNLTVDIPNSKLTCSITQAESDALVPGVYVGQANIAFGASLPILTEYFHVEVKERVASAL